MIAPSVPSLTCVSSSSDCGTGTRLPTVTVKRVPASKPQTVRVTAVLEQLEGSVGFYGHRRVVASARVQSEARAECDGFARFNDAPDGWQPRGVITHDLQRSENNLWRVRQIM